jgi:hypothetical protein
LNQHQNQFQPKGSELISFPLRATIGLIPYVAGIISIDSMNNCTWQPIRIGRVNSSNKIEIVFQSKREIPPEPFIEAYGSKKEWEKILDQLNEKIDSKADI